MLLSACNPTPPIEKVKVTFIGLDGEEISKVEVDKGTTVTPPNLQSIEEYTFNGWSLNKDGKDPFDFSTPITTDTILYSVWTNIEIIEKITVTFIDTKGSEVQQVEVEKGKRVTPPTLDPIGEYSLYGWSLKEDGEDLFDFSTPITSNTTLYSLWIKEYIDEVNGLIYKDNKDGSLSVIGVTNPYIMMTCSIPEEFEGKKITSIEDKAFSGCFLLSEIEIPSTITHIGELIFDSCYALSQISVSKRNSMYEVIDGVLYTEDKTSIIQYPTKKTSDTDSYTIPETVTKISSGAFYNSTLSSITIPDSATEIGDKAFYGSNITEITLPDSLKTIGEEAFALCEKLTTIEIPTSVSEIGFNAFYKCDSMNEIIVSEGNKNYKSEKGILFDKEMTKLINYPICKTGTEYIVPDTVTTIEAYSFFCCSLLEKVSIPDSVISIGDFAFYDCGNLIEISIPSTIKTIGERVFENCDKLTSVIIPNTVTSIEKRAFFNCSEMTSIYIPESVTSIGNEAFGNCHKLSEITVSDDNRYFTTKNGVLFNKRMTKLICYPEGKEGSEYTVPDGVTSLEPYSIHGSSLNTINLPNSLTTIREGALSYNRDLSTISIPERVTIIEPATFVFSSLTEIKVEENNKNYVTKDGVLFNKDLSTLIYYPSSKPVTEYSIPSGVTRIEDYAFFGNPNPMLQKIIIPASVTSIGNIAFFYYFNYAIQEIIINKPEGSISGAPWGAMYAKITWQNET